MVRLAAGCGRVRAGACARRATCGSPRACGCTVAPGARVILGAGVRLGPGQPDRRRRRDGPRRRGRAAGRARRGRLARGAWRSAPRAAIGDWAALDDAAPTWDDVERPVREQPLRRARSGRRGRGARAARVARPGRDVARARVAPTRCSGAAEPHGGVPRAGDARRGRAALTRRRVAGAAPLGRRGAVRRRAATRRLVDRRRLARDLGPVEAQDVLGRLGDQPLAQRVVGQQLLRPCRSSERTLEARKRSPTRRPRGTTSRSPPVSATMHGQPEAIASSATSPNGS